MSSSFTANGIYDQLKAHLSPQQLKQAETFLYAEYWLSPSACSRYWNCAGEDIPLRFHLDIDVNVR